MVWLWSVRVIHSECAQNGDKPSILGDYVFLAGSASEEGEGVTRICKEIKTPPETELRRVVPHHVLTQFQVADVFTKALDKTTFLKHRDRLIC